MKILICEDDEMMINVIDYKLKKDGYETEKAIDGKKAADLIKQNDFNLIITDLLMPYMSGLELVNLIRNDLKKTTPIIVLSKIGLEETVLKAFELGADDYMVKPFSPNELSVRAKRLLMKRS